MCIRDRNRSASLGDEVLRLEDLTQEPHYRHISLSVRAGEVLGVNLVTTFIGRDQTKTVEENLDIMCQVWPPILRLAEEPVSYTHLNETFLFRKTGLGENYLQKPDD